MTQQDIERVKALGFLRNRGTELFSGRIVPPGTVFSAQDLAVVAQIAERFGSGKVTMTSRQCAEIIGIPYEKIQEAMDFAQANGLAFGGTGAKIRPITACKGTTCVFGSYDTQNLARELHQRYYLGWAGVSLPHKFKIAVGGCPNSCIKPSLNDFGIEGHRVPRFDPALCRGCRKCMIQVTCPMGAPEVRDGVMHLDESKCISCGRCLGKCPFGAMPEHDHTLYRVFVGGTWGKSTRMGTALSRLVEQEELFPLLEKTMLWFRENAYQGERLGKAVDRLGAEALEQALWSDDLLRRKDEILAAPLKTR